LSDSKDELPLPYWLKVTLVIVQPVLVLLGIGASLSMQTCDMRYRQAAEQRARWHQERKDSLDIVMQQQAHLASIFGYLLDPDPEKRADALLLAKAKGMLQNDDLSAGLWAFDYGLNTDPALKNHAVQVLENMGTPFSVQVLDHLQSLPAPKADQEKLKGARERIRKRQNAVSRESLRIAEAFLQDSLWEPRWINTGRLWRSWRRGIRSASIPPMPMPRIKISNRRRTHSIARP